MCKQATRGTLLAGIGIGALGGGAAVRLLAVLRAKGRVASLVLGRRHEQLIVGLPACTA